jgi:threonyl-tRNA synthetase
VQAVVLPIADRHAEYAGRVASELRELGLRVHVDDRSESTRYKVREAQLQKVPYMLVVGDKEVEAGSVAVRHRKAGDLGPQPVAEFGERVARMAKARTLTEEAQPQNVGGVS